jgi:hypothetical protein
MKLLSAEGTHTMRMDALVRGRRKVDILRFLLQVHTARVFSST